MRPVTRSHVVPPLLRLSSTSEVGFFGFEVRAVHSSPSEFHLVIYDADDELTGTLDGNRYNDVEDLMNDARVQVGLERYEDGLGGLFG